MGCTLTQTSLFWARFLVWGVFALELVAVVLNLQGQYAGFFCSTRCSARGPVAYTQKSFSKTKQGTFRHDQSWMEATVIPPARITFAVQQETAKQTHHTPPKAHKTRHQAPAWSKAAKKKMPVANNLYNKEVKKYLPKPQS